MGGADRFGMPAVEDLGDRPQDLVGRGTIGGNRHDNDHHRSGHGRNKRYTEAAAAGTTSSRLGLDIPHRFGGSRGRHIRLDLAPQRQQRLDEREVSRHIKRHIKAVGSGRNAPDRIQQQIVPPHRDQGLDVQVVLVQTFPWIVRFG